MLVLLFPFYRCGNQASERLSNAEGPLKKDQNGIVCSKTHWNRSFFPKDSDGGTIANTYTH